MTGEQIFALHRFPGGLKLKGNKEAQTSHPILKLPAPNSVWLPMLQHRGLAATVVVESGQAVNVGDLIGKANGTLSANVHASIKGTIGRIESIPIAHRSGLSSLCVEIIAEDTQGHASAPSITPSSELKIDHDYHLEDPNVLRGKVADAGIVGLGGAAFPSALKLSAEADQQLHTLIINGAECAPYISCDEMLMREYAKELISGVQILLHILQINRCQIAIEEDRLETIACMKVSLEEAADERLQLCLVHAMYPEGGERQLIQVLSGKEVPNDGLPVDIGYLCHNVGTAYAVHQAFVQGAPLTSRIISVCGDGVVNPRNVEAPLGTTIADLITACGGYTEGTHRLIIGGPMMGFAVRSEQIPVDKGSNCLLVLPERDARQNQGVMPCIRCSACADVCPSTLLPQQLFYFAQAENFVETEKFNLFDCIECGCCDYVCPSNIPLTEYFRFAKDQLWLHHSQQRQAETARARFEQRQTRLVRQQQERDEARAARRQSAADKRSKQEQIKAAVARAQAQKKQRSKDDEA